MARRSNSGVDITTFKPTILQITRDLQLEDQKIKWNMRPAKTFGGRVWYGKWFNGVCYDAQIIINSNEGKYIPSVIAHELRHVFQRKHTWLEDKFEHGGWCRYWHNTFICTTEEENKLFSKNYKQYVKLPWEVDANDYAYQMTGIILPS